MASARRAGAQTHRKPPLCRMCHNAGVVKPSPPRGPHVARVVDDRRDSRGCKPGCIARSSSWSLPSARQRTLRTTIEWSYDLLTGGERHLFVQLGVFAGGCTFQAAESVADATLDTLHSLVDKSLVRAVEDRLLMLETIHAYAIERLESSGEAVRLGERHLE
jgi:hypothetical protein